MRKPPIGMVATLELEADKTSYGSLALEEGCDARTSSSRNAGRKAGRRTAAALLIGASFLFALWAGRSAPVAPRPEWMSDLEAVAAHWCPDFETYCDDHPQCLDKYHWDQDAAEGNSNMEVTRDLCADYSNDCETFCNECDCPARYCHHMTEPCFRGGIADKIDTVMGRHSEEEKAENHAELVANYGECAWHSSFTGAYTQENRLYPACPDGFTLFGVDIGGFCCIGDCVHEQEFSSYETICALDSNENTQHYPVCSEIGYNRQRMCVLMVAGSPAWSNYTIEFDMSMGGDTAGVLFNVQDYEQEDGQAKAYEDRPISGYMYAFSLGKIFIASLTDGQSTILATAEGATIAFDSTYHIKIHVEGGRIRAYREDNLEIDVTPEDVLDDHSTWEGGAVGISSWHADINVFNIQVKDPEGVSLYGHVNAFVTTTNIIDGFYVDGMHMFEANHVHVSLEKDEYMRFPATFKKLAFEFEGTEFGRGCVDEPPYRSISIHELDECLHANGVEGIVDFIDLGHEKFASDDIPWSPYEALFDQRIDPAIGGEAGSVMDAICRKFGYASFDLETTAAQEDQLSNPDSRKAYNLYPAANGFYHGCMCPTLDGDMYVAGDYSTLANKALCNIENFKDHLGPFPEQLCQTLYPEHKQYSNFYCQGGAGNVYAVNAFAASFVPSTENSDVQGLDHTTAGEGWKCFPNHPPADGEGKHWYEIGYDNSDWEYGFHVNTTKALPKRIENANNGAGADAQYLWVEDQNALKVFCTYEVEA